MTKEIARGITLALVAAIVAGAGTYFGITIDADALTTVLFPVVTAVVTLIFSALCSWFNTPVTDAAKQADQFMKRLKDDNGLLEDGEDDMNVETIDGEDEIEEE